MAEEMAKKQSCQARNEGACPMGLTPIFIIPLDVQKNRLIIKTSLSIQHF
jgi:hypothetical protein